jgi:hypothetical protein
MTPDDLRAAIERLWPGHGGQTRAAVAMGLKSSRRLRAYMAGERAVPDWLARELDDLLAIYPEGALIVDPRRSLQILHAQMVRDGWTESEAAAAILDAATDIAKRR